MTYDNDVFFCTTDSFELLLYERIIAMRAPTTAMDVEAKVSTERSLPTRTLSSSTRDPFIFPWPMLGPIPTDHSSLSLLSRLPG